MFDRFIRSKWRIMVNIILCTIALGSLCVNFIYRFMSINISSCITYLLIAIANISNAIYHKKTDMKKEFQTDILFCGLFIILSILMIITNR